MQSNKSMKEKDWGNVLDGTDLKTCQLNIAHDPGLDPGSIMDIIRMFGKILMGPMD